MWTPRTTQGTAPQSAPSHAPGRGSDSAQVQCASSHFHLVPAHAEAGNCIPPLCELSPERSDSRSPRRPRLPQLTTLSPPGSAPRSPRPHGPRWPHSRQREGQGDKRETRSAAPRHCCSVPPPRTHSRAGWSVVLVPASETGRERRLSLRQGRAPPRGHPALSPACDEKSAFKGENLLFKARFSWGVSGGGWLSPGAQLHNC